MALSNLYPDLERRDLHLTEWRFHIFQGKRHPEPPVKI